MTASTIILSSGNATSDNYGIVRQGIFEAIKFRESSKLAQICNFRGIKFSWILPYVQQYLWYTVIKFCRLDINHGNHEN